MATNAPVKKANSAQLATALNKQTANWSVLYMKLHHFHWYVKGPNFFALHAKFEELYNEATAIMDELAERVLTIGEKPVSTLKEQLSLTSIQEAKGGETADQMLQAIISDFVQVSEEMGQAAKLADDAGDCVTNDLLIGKQEWVEKTVWMLKATLD
ncbi:DNA starvation/stationary phase protection protein [Paenibacillaceae bacterium]|nr:DNA starvation/stationary phase protection protein [Paenibacillaceae bacterium]